MSVESSSISETAEVLLTHCEKLTSLIPATSRRLMRRNALANVWDFSSSAAVAASAVLPSSLQIGGDNDTTMSPTITTATSAFFSNSNSNCDGDLVNERLSLDDAHPLSAGSQSHAITTSTVLIADHTDNTISSSCSASSPTPSSASSIERSPCAFSRNRQRRNGLANIWQNVPSAIMQMMLAENNLHPVFAGVVAPPPETGSGGAMPAAAVVVSGSTTPSSSIALASSTADSGFSTEESD